MSCDRLGPTELDRVDRLEEAELELRRQVAEHPQRPEPGEGRGEREVDQPGEPLQRRDVGEDRGRLLGADDADRHQLRLGAHRRLDEPAAAEAAQPVAVLVELLGPLAALGEDEHQLALVEEQPVDVRRVRGDPADLRDQHREPGIALEEVLDRDVERARARVLLADRLRDHRRVRGQGAGVVGDQQRAAVGGHVLDPLDLGPEPVAVEELDQGAVHRPLDPLRAAPVVEPALGLDRGQQVAHPLGLAPLGQPLLGGAPGLTGERLGGVREGCPLR